MKRKFQRRNIVKLILVILSFILFSGVNVTAETEIKTNNLTIDSAIGILEKKLHENAPTTEIEKTTNEILKLKENSPIFYIPELKYLVKRNIKEIPKSKTEIYRKRIVQIDTLLSGLTTVLTILGSFSLIYFTDKIFSSEIKRNLAIFLGTILVLISLFTQGHLFYIIFGILAGFGFISRSKIPVSILMILLLFVHLGAKTANEILFEAVNSPKNQLIDKLQRDNYSPYFLISKAALPKNEEQIAKLANKQALLHKINIENWEKLLKEQSSSKEKAVILNNIGCILFQENNLKEAAEYFKKASDIYPLPKTYFNLFLTYSALLEPEKADFYSRKLKDYGYLLEKNVPIVSNIGDINKLSFNTKIPLISVIAIILPFLISSIISGKFVKKLSLISINPFFSYLPGYSLYYNNNYAGIILLTISIIAVEWIVRTLCLTSL